MPSQDIGSVPHEVGQLCDVCGSKSGVRLGARAACSAQDIGRAFSHALPVRAVDGRVQAYTDRERERERERETAGGEGVATRLQRQSVIVWSTVGELIMINC